MAARRKGIVLDMKSLMIFALAIALLLSGCRANQPPAPDSDSNQAFEMGSTIPVDDNVYTIKGKVVADIGNLQQQQAKGSVSGGGSAYGAFVSGSYAMWTEGKGFVRLEIKGIDPYTDYVQAGDVIIAKTTDQKVMALLPGDEITFKCRMQYEAVAAVRDNETFDATKLSTWEADYCRMVTPKIGD